jgi:DNA-binding PadR family transcriptional regulator
VDCRLPPPAPDSRQTLAIDGADHFAYNVGQMAAGQFEQLVLAAILGLRDNAYGVTIQSKAAELARPKEVSLGAVYVTLDRLEDKGFISSRLTDPTTERGGRAKRCYHLEALGEQALTESTATALRISDLIGQYLGKGWVKKWKKDWRKELA